MIPFYILVAIIVLTTLLGILGIIVEHTSLGTVKLSHEDTNFNNIDIPITQDGTTKDQLRQIMMIKDELLRNSKKLWASIILCFSFTRNLRQLFYNYKIHSDRLRHKNALYFIMVAGIIWFITFDAVVMGLV